MNAGIGTVPGSLQEEVEGETSLTDQAQVQSE